MPTVAEAARITTPTGAVWRHCAGCGRLAAMPDDEHHCDGCGPIPARQIETYNRERVRRQAVATLAASGIGAAREVYLKVPADAVRVAALVEMAAAAATLARTVMRLRGTPRFACWSAAYSVKTTKRSTPSFSPRGRPVCPRAWSCRTSGRSASPPTGCA